MAGSVVFDLLVRKLAESAVTVLPEDPVSGGTSCAASSKTTTAASIPRTLELLLSASLAEPRQKELFAQHLVAVLVGEQRQQQLVVLKSLKATDTNVVSSMPQETTLCRGTKSQVATSAIMVLVSTLPRESPGTSSSNSVHHSIARHLLRLLEDRSTPLLLHFITAPLLQKLCSQPLIAHALFQPLLQDNEDEGSGAAEEEAEGSRSGGTSFHCDTTQEDGAPIDLPRGLHIRHLIPSTTRVSCWTFEDIIRARNEGIVVVAMANVSSDGNDDSAVTLRALIRFFGSMLQLMGRSLMIDGSSPRSAQLPAGWTLARVVSVADLAVTLLTQTSTATRALLEEVAPNFASSTAALAASLLNHCGCELLYLTDDASAAKAPSRPQSALGRQAFPSAPTSTTVAAASDAVEASGINVLHRGFQSAVALLNWRLATPTTTAAVGDDKISERCFNDAVWLLTHQQQHASSSLIEKGGSTSTATIGGSAFQRCGADRTVLQLAEVSLLAVLERAEQPVVNRSPEGKGNRSNLLHFLEGTSTAMGALMKYLQRPETTASPTATSTFSPGRLDLYRVLCAVLLISRHLFAEWQPPLPSSSSGSTGHRLPSGGGGSTTEARFLAAAQWRSLYEAFPFIQQEIVQQLQMEYPHPPPPTTTSDDASPSLLLLEVFSLILWHYRVIGLVETVDDDREERESKGSVDEARAVLVAIDPTEVEEDGVHLLWVDSCLALSRMLSEHAHATTVPPLLLIIECLNHLMFITDLDSAATIKPVVDAVLRSTAKVVQQPTITPPLPSSSVALLVGNMMREQRLSIALHHPQLIAAWFGRSGEQAQTLLQLPPSASLATIRALLAVTAPLVPQSDMMLMSRDLVDLLRRCSMIVTSSSGEGAMVDKDVAAEVVRTIGAIAKVGTTENNFCGLTPAMWRDELLPRLLKMIDTQHPCRRDVLLYALPHIPFASLDMSTLRRVISAVSRAVSLHEVAAAALYCTAALLHEFSSSLSQRGGGTGQANTTALAILVQNTVESLLSTLLPHLKNSLSFPNGPLYTALLMSCQSHCTTAQPQNDLKGRNGLIQHPGALLSMIVRSLVKFSLLADSLLSPNSMTIALLVKVWLHVTVPPPPSSSAASDKDFTEGFTSACLSSDWEPADVSSVHNLIITSSTSTLSTSTTATATAATTAAGTLTAVDLREVLVLLTLHALKEEEEEEVAQAEEPSSRKKNNTATNTPGAQQWLSRIAPLLGSIMDSRSGSVTSSSAIARYVAELFPIDLSANHTVDVSGFSEFGKLMALSHVGYHHAAHKGGSSLHSVISSAGDNVGSMVAVGLLDCSIWADGDSPPPPSLVAGALLHEVMDTSQPSRRRRGTSSSKSDGATFTASRDWFRRFGERDAVWVVEVLCVMCRLLRTALDVTYSHDEDTSLIRFLPLGTLAPLEVRIASLAGTSSSGGGGEVTVADGRLALVDFHHHLQHLLPVVRRKVAAAADDSDVLEFEATEQKLYDDRLLAAWHRTLPNLLQPPKTSFGGLVFSRAVDALGLAALL